MKKFILITTRDGEAIVRSWVDVNSIIKLTQDSITQQGNNEGTCVFENGSSIGHSVDIIAFNETIDSLNK